MPGSAAISMTNSGSARSDASLRGPDLKSSHGFQNKDLIAELNRVGCYIHVVASLPGKVRDDFTKIEAREYPTPATNIGIAPVRLYNIAQWQNCSGIVLSPGTVSLLSHKHDFWSNRLKLQCPNGFSSYLSNRSLDQAYKDYAAYISDAFNAINGPTQSVFIQQTPKKLTLREDMAFAQAKYREMKIRSALERNSRPSRPVRDISSKYIIAGLLDSIFKPITKRSREDLLKALEKHCRKDASLKAVLEHAVIKIRKFDEARLRKYLQDAREKPPASKTDFYSSFIAREGTLAPNEHLLLPSMDDIKGVYVNIGSVEGIDQAFQIKEELERRQSNRLGSRIPYIYAFLYLPSAGASQPISSVGWSKVLQPWTSAGLIEFARTGRITAADETRSNFVPEYFKIFDTIGRACSRFLNDLSGIRDASGNNLLHLAVRSNRSLDVIKFLVFWKVSPTAAGPSGQTALELAQRLGHPAADFLNSAVGMSSWAFEREKQAFIARTPGGPK